MDWEALRAEYVAGEISQKALAEKHGIGYGAVSRRARRERWTALRGKGRAEGGPEGPAAGEGQKEPERGREGPTGGEAEEKPEGGREGQAGDDEIMARLRRKLLMRLEHVTDKIPDGPVTELKEPKRESGETRLFKLRDLIAAYKEMASSMPGGGAEESGEDIEDLSPLVRLLED